MNLFALFGSNPSQGINTLLGIFDSQSAAVHASAEVPKGVYTTFYVSPYVLNELKGSYSHEELHEFTPEGH